MRLRRARISNRCLICRCLQGSSGFVTPPHFEWGNGSRRRGGRTDKICWESGGGECMTTEAWQIQARWPCPAACSIDRNPYYSMLNVDSAAIKAANRPKFIKFVTVIGRISSCSINQNKSLDEMSGSNFHVSLTTIDAVKCILNFCRKNQAHTRIWSCQHTGCTRITNPYSKPLDTA